MSVEEVGDAVSYLSIVLVVGYHDDRGAILV